MTVELRPLGVHCNIACQYCYQNPQRIAGNLNAKYDIELMKEAIEDDGSGFSLFGGEPLLLPEEDLEKLWSWGFARFGRNAVQTNGTLINSTNIEMFRKYKVAVGISCDGPGELNDIRWAGSIERTREATAKTEAAIEALCKAGMAPSLIVTLHRHNATRDKLPRMVEWLQRLDAMGVWAARLHILEVDDAEVREACSLTDAENTEAFLTLRQAEKNFKTMRFDYFDEMRRLLMGREHGATCVWRACDPYTTAAVSGVEGHGERSNCGRTNKDGIDFVKAPYAGFERYIALYNAPQEEGGCNGCRFFLMCKGQCPGTSINGDWRNRSEHCATWMAVFEHLESELLEEGKQPLSLDPRREAVEDAMLATWADGRNSTMDAVLATEKV